MAFSTGLYQQNVAPQQQDVRLQAPLMKQQVDGLASVFGKGLEAFSEVLAQREQYEKEMAAIATANDKRAAQLAASGISSTDAIQMAWEESRYAVPKTWGDVGKQNAISDLAAKANNGWVGGQTSALTVETAMADLNLIQQNGINGVKLEDMNWIDGSGMKALVAATRPSSETMIALGPNAGWVRNQILDKVAHLSDVYTKKQKDNNLLMEKQHGRAQMRNMLGIDLRGEKVDPYLAADVTRYINNNPEDATQYAEELMWQNIETAARPTALRHMNSSKISEQTSVSNSIRWKLLIALLIGLSGVTTTKTLSTHE